MATKQTTIFKGMARRELPSAHKAGEAQEVIITHVFNEAVNTTDVLELFALPAGCRFLSFEYAAENIGAINANIGFMTGVPGDNVTARTSGTELVSAGSLNTTGAEVTIATLAAIASTSDNRSIGLVPAANITAASNKKLHLRVRYGRD